MLDDGYLEEDVIEPMNRIHKLLPSERIVNVDSEVSWLSIDDNGNPYIFIV